MRVSSTTPLLRTFVVTIVTLSSAMLSPFAHANLVLNGGFEDGPVVQQAFGGTASGGSDTSKIKGSLANWDTGPTGGGLNVLATNQSAYYASSANLDPVNALSGPHGGDLAAVFPNFPAYDGYISQAVSGAVIGYFYKIGFWLANQVGDDANNYMDVKWGGTIASPGAAIVGGSSLAGGSPAIPGAIPVPTDWTYYEFIKAAPSNDARLSFIGGNDAAGNLIDDVSVEFYAVPEVSSFGTAMGLGLLALGTMGRVRRRSCVTA